MKRLIFLLFLGAAGALMVRHYLFEGIYIATESMMPTLPAGTHVMVKKFPFRNYKPRHGDIVMFDSPVQKEKGFVKRVIAMGGDTIEIRSKKVFLNGKELVEPYASHQSPYESLVGDNMELLTVPEGMVFLLGDNRDVSGDSRFWRSPAGERIPFIALSEIQGVLHVVN